jgi:hypothetical protein
MHVLLEKFDRNSSTYFGRTAEAMAMASAADELFAATSRTRFERESLLHYGSGKHLSKLMDHVWRTRKSWANFCTLCRRPNKLRLQPSMSDPEVERDA